VYRDGEPLRLTAKEFDLLYFLARHPRRVFSREQLMDRVWGYEAALDTGTVTVHIREGCQNSDLTLERGFGCDRRPSTALAVDSGAVVAWVFARGKGRCYSPDF
jgi:hypothetical protein